MDRPDDSPAVEVLQEVAPEKTSAWTEAELARAEPPPPTLPEWASAFAPGDGMQHNGWDCVIRAVGEPEPGFWFVMIEPLRRIETKVPRSVKRSEYKRLVHRVGKKSAREITKERGNAST